MNRNQRRRASKNQGGLFLHLKRVTEEQIDLSADTLHEEGAVAMRIDPSPAYAMFVSSASRGLPYEVDLLVVRDPQAHPPVMLGMTREDRSRLLPWMEDTVKRLCTRWKERHPPSPELDGGPVILTVDLQGEEPRQEPRHHAHMAEPTVMMISVKGIPESQWVAMTPEQQGDQFPAGSAYFTVYRPNIGRVLRGTVTKTPAGDTSFTPLSDEEAVRLAGNKMRMDGLERWLLLRAADVWGGEWREHAKTLSLLEFEVMSFRFDGQES